MRHAVSGTIAAVVLVGVMFLTPRILRSSADRAGGDAAEQAEQARRELMHYDHSLPVADASANLSAARDVDLDKLMSGEIPGAKAVFDKLSAELSAINQAISARKSADAAADAPQGAARPMNADPSSIRASVTAMEQLIQANRALLNGALAKAQQAGQLDNSTIGVAYVRGLVKLAEAETAFAESIRLRRELGAAQSRAVQLATDWALIRAAQDEQAAVDTSRIESKLDADGKDLDEMRKAAQAEADALAAAIAAREADLAKVRAALAEARNDYLTIQDAGFRAGDDPSFQSYSQRLSASSAKLRDLQETEQLLVGGGRKGAVASGDDLETAALEGGEDVPAIEHMQADLARARARVERLSKAIADIKAHAANIAAGGSAAKAEAQRYDGLLKQAFAAVDGARKQLEDLSVKAQDAESRAIAAAGDASQSFSAAATAAGKFVSAAQSAKREHDPEGKNDRLKRIIADDRLSQQAVTAKAQASALAGRVNADRLVALESYKHTLEILTKLVPGSTFEAQPLTDAIEQARAGAIGALGEARDALAAPDLAGKPTSWIHQATLACVHYELSRVDPLKQREHLAAAADNIVNAVTRRELSPYMPASVLALRTALAGDAPRPAPAPSNGDANPADAPPPGGG